MEQQRRAKRWAGVSFVRPNLDLLLLTDAKLVQSESSELGGVIRDLTWGGRQGAWFPSDGPMAV